ncbi:hypothetical protein B0H14DRAFT_2566550 [Mycena olivaceomarginata]|nr:hypothetical protein B0H14DRAFT_2566550 [Mycena olivaceomarginata]
MDVLIVPSTWRQSEWEVQYIWKPPHRKATAWYFLVRYVALDANVALFTLSFVNFPAETCRCLTFVNVHDVPWLVQGLVIERTAGSREAMLLADLVFLGLALHRAYIRTREETKHLRGSLFRVVIRNGVIYYMLSYSRPLEIP